MQKLLILTNTKGEKIIIGAESIIDCTPHIDKFGNDITKIRSREAMATTNYVTESIEEIYEQYKQI